MQTAYSGTPQVGDTAPEFELKTLEEKRVQLKELRAKGPIVLVVLRGWPGYQCPLCTEQAQDFVRQSDQFRKHGVQLVMVYPGPNENLKAHAQEFLQNQMWPQNLLFVTDPITGSRNNTVCVGMRKMKPLIPQPSLSTKTGKSRLPR